MRIGAGRGGAYINHFAPARPKGRGAPLRRNDAQRQIHSRRGASFKNRGRITTQRFLVLTVLLSGVFALLLLIFVSGAGEAASSCRMLPRDMSSCRTFPARPFLLADFTFVGRQSSFRRGISSCRISRSVVSSPFAEVSPWFRGFLGRETDGPRVVRRGRR